MFPIVVKLKINIAKTKKIYKTSWWYRDGILTVNINCVDEYISILEVVGNAIIKGYDKMISDRNKAMCV